MNDSKETVKNLKYSCPSKYEYFWNIMHCVAGHWCVPTPVREQAAGEAACKWQRGH